MSDAGLHPLEKVLRLCAGPAPEPWYPAVYSRETGASLDALVAALDKLWFEGLVRKARGTPETGLGFVVSPAGERLLADPDALRRLREGQPLWPADPGSVVRHSLLHPGRPLVCRLVLLANALVFAYGLSLAYQAGITTAFLVGFSRDPRFSRILHLSGAVSAPDLLAGEWWRLLTNCFVHSGLLHIGMNMYAVSAIGAFAEQTWGRLRFLLIYLLAGWGGSCLAMAYHPVTTLNGPGGPVDVLLQLVGASGAVCGILGAEAVWVLVAGRHLPPEVRRRAWRGVIINSVLIAFISMVPGVSGLGHLGGALAGAAVALVLHAQRFGPAPLRWLAPLALLPLPWLGVALIDRARADSPAWKKVVALHERHLEERRRDEERRREAEDRADFEKRFFTPNSPTFVRTVAGDAWDVYQGVVYQGDVADPRELDPGDRAPARVRKEIQALGEQREKVEALARAIEEAGPYQEEVAEKARRAGREYARALAELLDQTRHCLRLGKKCTRQDKERLRGQESQVKELRGKWKQFID
jgi:membrane associated rhomboid family serine protease